MSWIDVFETAVVGGGLVLAAGSAFASIRRLSLSSRRALLATGLAVAAAAPTIAIASTALGLGLRPEPIAVPDTRAPGAAPVRAESHARDPEDSGSPGAGPTIGARSAATRTASAPTAAATSAQPRATRDTPWLELAALVWLAGAAFGLVRIARDLIQLRQLRRSLEPCIDARVAGAYVTTRLSVPATVGIVRPVVALPRALLEDVANEDLAAIVRHERSHVARHDPLVGLGARVARAFHWPNPLAHLAARQLGAACEAIADGEAVAGHEALAPRYATCLVRLAEGAITSPTAAGVDGIVDHRGHLTRRVEALLDPATTPDPRASRVGRVATLAFGTVACAAIVCGCCSARPCTPPCRDDFARSTVGTSSSVGPLSRLVPPNPPARNDGVSTVDAGGNPIVQFPDAPKADAAESDLATTLRMRIVLKTKRIKGLEFRDENLDHVATYLRTVTGLNFYITPNVRVSKYDGVRITIPLKDEISADEVLSLVTTPYGLVWYVRSGVVTIAALEEYAAVQNRTRRDSMPPADPTELTVRKKVSESAVTLSVRVHMLKDILHDLEGQSGVPLHLDPRASDIGDMTASPAELAGITLETALDLLAEAAGRDVVWIVQGDAVVFTRSSLLVRPKQPAGTK